MKKSVPSMIALFAALTGAGCFIQIPLPGGVPIVIQDMFAILSGLLLGPLYGGLAVLLFLVLGSIGLPLFSGKAGIQVILQGPTGGFLVGYLLAAVVGGLILKFALKEVSSTTQEKYSKINFFWIIIAASVSTIVVFLFGGLGFARITHSGMVKTFSVVVLPFIPGNIIKIIVMVPIIKKFRPIVKNYIG